jgi:multicomponent Na+:H+ antiporter subunit F
MITDGPSVLNLAGTLALTLLMVSVVLSFVRMVRGPRAADRVVALDLICVLVIAVLAAYAVHTGDSRFLDVAIAYALVAFLGTVALSRFLLRGRRRENNQPTSTEEP